MLLARLGAVALAARGAPSALTAAPALARVRTLCASANLPPHLEDLKEELESGEAQLFDVREPGETMSGKIVGADLVPLSELQQGLKPEQDPTKLTYVHCAAGIRVHYAAPILESMGFERVVPLAEGYASLVREYGFEAEKPSYDTMP